MWTHMIIVNENKHRGLFWVPHVAPIFILFAHLLCINKIKIQK